MNNRIEAVKKLLKIAERLVTSAKPNLKALAAEFIKKNPRAIKPILSYIRHGRGYSDPTDLFDNDIPGFTDEVEGKPDPLYSRAGAIALMDAVTTSYNQAAGRADRPTQAKK